MGLKSGFNAIFDCTIKHRIMQIMTDKLKNRRVVAILTRRFFS